MAVEQKQKLTDVQQLSREAYIDERMRGHNRFYKDIYNLLYTINDFTIAAWFLIGSVFFYFESTKVWGVTLFVVASFQFMIKPTIRLVHEIKARRYYGEEYDELKNQS